MTDDAAWLETHTMPLAWASGSWSLLRAGDELTDISFAGRPVLRSVRCVARDAAWGTVPTDVTRTSEDSSALELQLRQAGVGAEIDATMRAEVDGDILTISVTATMRSEFPSNRTGLIVLHDQAVAGAQLQVVDVRGESTETTFPLSIAPLQPATDIRSLAWTSDHLDCELDFEGAVFEMEDQRNWTDASFKTYSGPLRDPRPIAYQPGDVVEQRIVLRAHERRAVAPLPARLPLQIRAAGALVPAVQLGASTGPDPVPRLQSLPAAGILVELDAGGPWWRDALRRARGEANGLPLDVRIAAASAAEVSEVLAELGPVRRLGVVDRATHVTTPELWSAIEDAPAELTAGTRGHFTQLNRTIDLMPASTDALTFSMTPQVHARERRQLVESIAGQRSVVESALRLAAGRQLDIGPITLRPRITIDLPGEAGTQPDVTDGYGPEDVPDSTDPRIDAPAMIAWTIASFAVLARAGVRSITLFEVGGARGIHNQDGTPRPLLAAVEALHALVGLPLLEFTGDLPTDVWALAAGDLDDPVILAANLAPDPRPFEMGRHATVIPAWSALRLHGRDERVIGAQD